jgi:hypothetical protein
MNLKLLLLIMGMILQTFAETSISRTKSAGNLSLSPAKNTRPSSNIKQITRTASMAAFKGGMYGAVAGAFQVLALMWLRTIINYQYRYGVSLEEAIQALNKQGGIKRFYKGISYALVQNPLAKFGSSASNQASKIIVNQALPLSPIYTSAVGTFLTIFWRLLFFPIETCKTVLQVDGNQGFKSLLSKVKAGHFSVLYQGVFASIATTFLCHYPWFLVFHWLDRLLPKARGKIVDILRYGSIAFVATTCSDTISNFLRVIKTVKQTMSATEQQLFDYRDIVSQLYQTGGLLALFGRGLLTRIIANGLQNFLFIIIWKLLPMILEKQQQHQLEPLQDEKTRKVV